MFMTTRSSSVRSVMHLLPVVLCAIALTLPGSVRAQDGQQQASVPSVAVGVDWVASGDFVDAAGDLIEMAEVGFTAVRMPPVFDRGFYTLADSLGLTLYIELPLTQLTTRQLNRMDAEADSILTMVLQAGRDHASAGPVGITRLSDTRSPRACDAIGRMATRIREAGRQAYYTTVFRDSDACVDMVDFVLIDVLGSPDPLVEMERVIEHRNVLRAGAGNAVSPPGIAGLGVPVTRPGLVGWSVAGTPQAQARFMETALNRVLDAGLTHVFLHRWRDVSGPISMPDPWERDYGLYTGTSDPRPALQVVRGILLDIQDTFAFDPGTPPDKGQPWFPVLGWIMITMTALMYAGSPRFRSMIPRYFFAHGFFRNAVREAREVLPLTSTAILTVTGLSVGLIGSFVITGLQDTALAVHWYRLLGPTGRESLTAIMGAPFVLTILLGSTTLLSASLWMGFWMAVSGRRTRLLPSQALMLASWPRWQVLILLPLAMTLNASSMVPGWAILVLGAGWVLTAFWATIRTAYDLYKITHVPALAAGLVWMLHPLVMAVVVLTIWSLFNWHHVRLAWHLLQVG